MTTNNDFVKYDSSLLYYNFPSQPGRAQPAQHHIQIEHLLHSSNLTDEPVFCFQANGRISDLETLVHTDEELEFLLDKTIQIYLYEPMCCYLIDDPNKIYPDSLFNCGFYSEFNPGTESQQRSLELNSIQLYAEHNGLDNIVVRTGDYGADVYSETYPNLTLLCDDAFLQTMAVYSDVLFDQKHIDTTFISTNWRFTPSRAVISALLAPHSTNLVWNFHVEPDVLQGAVWINPDAKFLPDMLTGLTKLNEEPTRWLDIPVGGKQYIDRCNGSEYPLGTVEKFGNPVGLNNRGLPLKEYYRTSFVDIVTESRYAQPTANISEKVMQSIQFKTPFILVAPPFSLQYLRELGFWTFDRWWDESYDLETNHQTRMEMIADIIQHLASLTFDQLNTLYAEMQSVLDHNLHMLVVENSAPGEFLDRESNNAPVLVHWLTDQEK